MERKNEYFGDYNKSTNFATFFSPYIILNESSGNNALTCLSAVADISTDIYVQSENPEDMSMLVKHIEYIADKEITYCSCKDLFKENTVMHFIELLRNCRVAINTLYSGQSWQIIIGYIGHGSYEDDILVLYDSKTKETKERHLTEVLDMWVDWEMIYSPIK